MLGYVPKSLVAEILAHTEHGHRGRGSIKNPVCEGYVPKNLVAKILAHVEHGHRGPGSIKNPVCEGYVPKNLVAKILAHVEHGHRGPGSIKNSKVRCPEIHRVNRCRFLFKIGINRNKRYN